MTNDNNNEERDNGVAAAAEALGIPAEEALIISVTPVSVTLTVDEWATVLAGITTVTQIINIPEEETGHIASAVRAILSAVGKMGQANRGE